MARRAASAPTPETEQRELECALTQAELLLRGEELASCGLEIEKLKSTRKGVNGQIADLAEQRTRLDVVVDTGKETRMVLCEWRPDWQAGLKTLVRLDTNEPVTTEPIEDEERQTDLGLAPATPIDSARKRGTSKTTDHEYPSDPTVA